MTANCRFVVTMRPSRSTTRIPSAVDSRVARKSEMMGCSSRASSETAPNIAASADPARSRSARASRTSRTFRASVSAVKGFCRNAEPGSSSPAEPGESSG